MCDKGKDYNAYAQFTAVDGTNQLVKLKYVNGGVVNNKPDRLRNSVSGTNPNLLKLAPVIYKGVTYVPDLNSLNTNNCTSSMLSGNKMVFPFVQSNGTPSPVTMTGGRKHRRRTHRRSHRRTRSHRKRTHRRR
jgi:hypothetical protein